MIPIDVILVGIEADSIELQPSNTLSPFDRYYNYKNNNNKKNNNNDDDDIDIELTKNNENKST